MQPYTEKEGLELAKLARQAAQKSCRLVYQEWSDRDPKCIDALGFAELQVIKISRKHRDWDHAGIYSLARKRTTEFLAKQLAKESRCEQAADFISAEPTPDVYAACDDDTDRRMVDFLTAPVDRLTNDNVRRTTDALGLPYQETRHRINGFRQRHHAAEFAPRPESTADPAILLKARDEYRRDHKAGDYKLSRIFWYCCRDVADHHTLAGFFDDKEPESPDANHRLGVLAHRFLEM